MKTIAVQIEYDPQTKTYGATSVSLPDIYAVSDSRDDALHRFIRSTTDYLAYLRESNEPMPEALDAHHEIVTVVIEAA